VGVCGTGGTCQIPCPWSVHGACARLTCMPVLLGRLPVVHHLKRVTCRDTCQAVPVVHRLNRVTCRVTCQAVPVVHRLKRVTCRVTCQAGEPCCLAHAALCGLFIHVCSSAFWPCHSPLPPAHPGLCLRRDNPEFLGECWCGAFIYS